MNSLHSLVNSLEWRRNKVMELSSQGRSQPEIARLLQISQPTINRDLSFLRQCAKENIKGYINDRLPEEYEKCLVGLNSILREVWSISQSNEAGRMEKIKALNLAKDCYVMKLELLTNATVVDDAIRFVQSNLNLSTSGHHPPENVELINEVNGTERRTGKCGFPLHSNNEVVTVNKTF